MDLNFRYGVIGKCEDSGAPIVSYSRKLDKEGLRILVDNDKINSWEHTGIYGTFDKFGVGNSCFVGELCQCHQTI